jgi:hypothetical protein
VPLVACFDESIRDEGSSPICVGGYLFRAGAYTRFSERWRREVLRLKNRKIITHFHMTELCAGRGQFQGISIDDRVHALSCAVDVISALCYASVGISFRQKEFEQMAPPEWPTFRGSIYSVACHMCLQTTAHWLRSNRSHLDVEYVFEDGHRMKGEADNVLKAIAKDERARKHFRYRNHRFAEKGQEYGLQAADLLVWVVTKAAIIGETRKMPKALYPFIFEIRRLGRTLNDRTHIHEFTGDLLERFLVEQSGLTGQDHVLVNFGPRKPRFR